MTLLLKMMPVYGRGTEIFQLNPPRCTRVPKNNLPVDAKSLFMNEIKMKDDGGPEWPTLEETRVDI